MAVGRFLPLRGKIPIIGNVVVIENHQRRLMRQRSRDLVQASLERVDARLLQGITLAPFLDQFRRFWRDQGPGRRRPDQQVHGHDFGEGHQVVVGVAGREDRLALAAEKALAQGVVAFQRRQQVGAVVVAGRVLVQRLAVGYHRTFQLLVEQAQARDQAMDGAQHGARDIVGVNLVARHH
ncbi:hypothetical protein D9M71_454420 [compost metagenome]